MEMKRKSDRERCNHGKPAISVFEPVECAAYDAGSDAHLIADTMKTELVLVLACLSFSACTRGSAEPAQISTIAERGAAVAKNISVEDADKLLKQDKNVVVLDVRTEEEFKAGHIPGAKNIDFHEPNFKQKLGALDKSKTYVLHCQAGGRSAKAEAMMKELQFKSILHLKEGFGKWEAAGKSVEK